MIHLMFNANLFTRFSGKFFKTSGVITLAFVFGANVFTAFGQDDLRRSVYGETKKNSSDKKKSSRKKPPVKNASANKNTANNKKTAAKNYVSVTFVAKEPDVEVYLNDRRIGETGEDFQLSKRLSPGEYLLTAKNKNQVFLSDKKITVTAEQTNFNLFEEIIPEPTPNVEPAVEKKEKSEAEIAAENSRKVKKILADYADPTTTDAVTTEDWQTVFQAAQAGQIQDYTAVQLDAQRWFASGQIELAKGEFANAVTAFNKSQEFMPKSALPSLGLGNTYFAQKNYAEASKHYQRALQLDPKMAVAHKKLGDTNRFLGKEKEAITAYKNAVQFGYRTPETRYWLGTLMLGTKQIEEAVKELEAVAKEMPRAEVFISIGSGYEKLKRDVSAIDAYQKAIDADPNSALAYYKLADVYTSQREYTKAKESYEKALSLDPEGKTFNKTEAQKKMREAASKINK